MPAATHIGLDVGSTSIRAVEVDPHQGPAGDQQLRPGPAARRRGGRRRRQGRPRGDLGAAPAVVRRRTSSTKNVILGVSHQQVIVRDVEIVESAGEGDAAGACRSWSATCCRCRRRRRCSTSTRSRIRARTTRCIGLLIAAPKEAVIDMVRAVERAGLHVDRRRPRLLRGAACGRARRRRHRGGHRHRRRHDELRHPHRRHPADRADDPARRRRDHQDDGDPAGHVDGRGRSAQVPRRPGHAAKAPTSPRSSTEAHPAAADRTAQLADLLPRRPTRSAGEPAGPRRRRVTAARAHSSASPTNSAFPPICPTRCSGVSDSRRGGRHDVLGRFRSSAAVSIGLTLGAA